MKHSVFFYAVLFFLVLTVNFFLPRMIPGSPIANIAGENVGELTETERENILAAYDLDKPLHVQFKNYIVGFFTFEWGTSYIRHQPITKLIGQALPWTLLLSLSNLFISTILGCFLGYRSAFKRKDRKDLKYMLGVSAISSLPLFWVGMTFVAVFSVTLNLFPLNNAYSLWENYTGIQWLLDVLWHLALPVMTLVTSTMISFFVNMRYGILTVINEDYIMMAELRGLSKKRIRYAYILRNAIIPVFTVFMLEFGYILGGSVVIESIFSYPGVGKLMYDAVITRDYPLVQYSFVMVSFMVIFANLIADFLYSKIDVRMEKIHE